MTTAAPFALGTFGDGERVFAGLVVGDRVLDLSSRLSSSDRLVPGLEATGRGGTTTTRDLLDRWDDVLPVLTDLAADAAAAPSSSDDSWVALSSLRVLAPVEPRQILQAGANYRKHVIDLSVKHAELSEGRTEAQVRAETAAMMDRRAAEGIAYVFIGLPSAITGPYDDVVLPADSQQHDWELELAAVIGRPAYRVSRSQALEHVAGYTIVNDLTTRDLVFRRDMPEIGTDWFRGKNSPGFLPTGPFLVPSAFAGDPADLTLRLELNGEVMQDESTSDMIFDVAAIVSAASQTARLLPGDLVLTGSPAGNGMHWGRLLRPGDVMDATITGHGALKSLGTQRTHCIVDEVAS